MNVQNIAAWLTVVSVTASCAWIAYQYDERIRAMETRVNILLGASPSSTLATAENSESSGKVSQNVCDNLALRAADAIERRQVITELPDIKDLMRDLNCVVE